MNEPLPHPPADKRCTHCKGAGAYRDVIGGRSYFTTCRFCGGSGWAHGEVPRDG